MYELKWRGKVILVIIWNFQKYHASRNPKRKIVPAFPNPAVSGVDE